ncbi:ComEA family DNA-binding protein [Nesterenkonia sp.]|uniref:ComEA family DNA-binding protein n=1 Tax=Nesterenkonia sp. TaxID=704201 RepID=UPI00262507DA|nr:ComEA family DNA-binding protein [Nesterenkonia sp.]
MEHAHQDEVEQLTRREHLRLKRRQAHASPVRIRLRLGAVLVIAAGLLSWLAVSWLLSSSSSSQGLPEPAELTAAGTDRPRESPPQNPAAEQEASPQESILVHVAGAVAEPQLVELEPGSRVADAVEAAGGLTADAAPAGVNLAAEAQDGTLLWVPTVEEFEHSSPPPAPGGVETGPEKINLNTATAEELEELSGIGPALAERIITHRETHGSFGSVEELAAVSGIGPAIIENIADDVTW